MNLGETLDVYRRDHEGDLGPLIGTARLVQPDVAQAIPPLDAVLAGTSDDTLALAVRPRGDTRSDPVDARDHYVGLVSPDEADRIAAQECPALRLVDDASVLVFLGLRHKLADPDPDQVCTESTLCKIVCLWYCSNC
ncbi:MAG TPA: hypothetical protein VGC57_00150 [Cellulomonas sp.]